MKEDSEQNEMGMSEKRVSEEDINAYKIKIKKLFIRRKNSLREGKLLVELSQ